MTSRTLDPRFHRSRASLIEAAGELVRERPVDQISITDIAKTAGVTRPTFYQHFEDVPAAVRAAALHQLNMAYPPADYSAETIASDEIQKFLEARAVPVLQHLWQDRDFYRRVVDGAGNIELFDAFVDIVSDRMMLLTVHKAADRDRKLMLAGGIMWVVVKWLRTETGAVRPRIMARRLVDLVMKMGDV